MKDIYDVLEEHDMDEELVRVCSYHPVKQWQAIVRFRDRTKPWGVGISEDRGKARSIAAREALYLCTGHDARDHPLTTTPEAPQSAPVRKRTRPGAGVA